MAETLQVIIQGKDGVSRVFKEVGQSAQDAGKKVEDAGRKGEQGFRRVGESAERAKVSVSDLGAAMTVIGTALGYAGNKAMEQERQIIGLRRAYGDAADEMLRFAEELDDVTMFTDDDIRAGERFFATLRNNYDMSIDQIQELMRITADLAANAGVSFEDASNRVTAAIRGEAEAAEYLGLTMNQAAIDRENLTLTMSNAEAAQFRYNALLEQSAVYQGTAADMMESSAGQLAEWRDRVEDAAASVGQFVGPFGSMVGGFGLAVGGLGNLTGAFSKFGGVLRAITPALGVIARHPLFIGGAVLAGGIALWDKISDSWNRAEREQQALADSSASLNETLNNMRVVMGQLEGAQRFELVINQWGTAVDEFQAKLAQAQRDWEETGTGWLADLAQEDPAWVTNPAGVAEKLWEQLDLTEQEIADVNTALTALGPLFTNTSIDQARLSAEISKLFDEFQRTGDAQALEEGLLRLNANSQDLLLSTNALATSLANLGDELDALRFTGQNDLARDLEQLAALQIATEDVLNVLTSGEANAYNEAWENIWEAVREGEVDADALIAKIAELDEQLASRQITPRQYAAAIALLGLNLDDYAVSSDTATASTGDLGASMVQAAVAADGLVRSLIGLNREAATGALDILNAGLTEMIGNFEDAGESAGGMLDGITDRVRGELEELIGYAEEFIASMQELANIDMADRVNMAGLGTDATFAAASINDAASALDSVLTIYGSIDAMSSRMSQAGGIADALFGPDGDPYDAVGPLRDVFDAGLISVEQFNSAIADGIEIQRSAATSELYLNKIRADQLPLLRETTDAYQAQIKAISEMSAADQMVALGWMDSGMQGRVEQFTEMISLMNNFGAEGEAAMQQVIDGIVATDPVLTAMLEDLGLIEQQLDGSYTLSLDAEGAVSDIERLTASIDALTLALGGTPPSYDIDVTGIEDVEAANTGIEDLIRKAQEDLHVKLRTELEAPQPGDADYQEWNTLIDPIRLAVDFDASNVQAQLRDVIGDGTGGPEVTVPVNLQVPTDLPPLPQPEPIEVPITFTTGAGFVGDAVSGALGAFGDGEDGATVTITAIDNASATIEEVINAASSVPESEQVAVSAPGAPEATSALNEVTAAAAGIPEIEVISVVASGATEAANALNAVAAAANSIPSTVNTTVTTTIRTVNLGTDNNLLPGGRHGGMPGYAMGGVLFEGGEAGMEMAHFATGGVALMPRHAIYEAPRGTYIEPANSVGSVGVASSGDTYQIHIHGNVYGVDDLVGAMTAAITRQKTGQGVRV